MDRRGYYETPGFFPELPDLGLLLAKKWQACAKKCVP
jgi:hypothetical protein